MRRASAVRVRPAAMAWLLRHPTWWSIALVAMITLLLWLVTPYLDVANMPLFYLLGVLVCATTVGLRPAVLCALLASFAYNFFFVEPIHTLHVTRGDDMLRLVLFLLTAIIGGGLAARERERAELAQRRAREMAALYRLSQAISLQLDFAQVAPTLLKTTIQLLQSPAATIMLPDRRGVLQELAREGRWPAEPVFVDVPLQLAGQPLGQLRVVFPASRIPLPTDQRRLLETLASQAALALQRSHLARAAAHAEALAESDRLKSALLSSVSHDFRTPLASITAAADELLSDDVSWSPAATRNFGAVIWGQANRLNYLVTNLLDLSRIEAGVLRPNIGWYNIAEIVEKALERLSAELEGRAIALDAPDDLPLVPVDYVQIEQVLWNILQNALKYSPSGSTIHVKAEASSHVLLLTVADRGPGIPPEQRQQVFKPFYRLAQPDHGQISGLGIGLAICKGLVDAHHGSIRIVDHPGGGSIVELTLPLTRPEKPERQPAL